MLSCKKCKLKMEDDFFEESHDVPIYFFKAPTRSLRKQQADKFGRAILCKECHDVYERRLLKKVIKEVLNQEVVLNNPDRRTLIPCMNIIKVLDEHRLIKCREKALLFREEFFK